MCGISFRRAENFKNYFSHNSHRGTDGLGIIHKDGFVKELPALKTAETHQKFLDEYVNNFKENDFLLLHHRKQSIGAIDIKNVHPFIGKKFAVIQNGSSSVLSNWGAIEMGENDRSDTFFLSRLLESKCKNFADVCVQLERISLVTQLGVVIVVDKQTREILYFSDGARSFYFDLTSDNKRINYCGSLADDSLTEYKNIGYAIWDFDGNVKEMEIESINFHKKHPTQQSFTTHSDYNWVKTYDYTTINTFYVEASKKKIRHDCAKRLAELEKLSQDWSEADTEEECRELESRISMMFVDAEFYIASNQNDEQQARESELLENYRM